MDRPHPTIFRFEPLGRITPRRTLSVAAGRLDPRIRIAHRRRGVLQMPTRIIFDYELVLFLAGSGSLTIGPTRHTVRPHALFIVPPFVPHSIDCDARPCEHVAVHFDLSPVVPGRSGNPSRRPPYAIRLSHGLALPETRMASPAVERALLDLVAVQSRIHPLSALRARSLLLQVLMALLEEPSPATGGAGAAAAGEHAVRQRRLVERVIGYVGEHLAEPLDADLLADVAGISASQLTRLFRRVTGYAPLDYVRHARIERGRQLLADIDLSVKQIAAQTGFADTFHFSKTFRRLVGVPPTAYRQAILSRPE